MKIKVLIHAEPKGGYWAEVPALPGCYTQGESHAELIINIHEAVELWMEAAAEDFIPSESVSSELIELAH